jgi:hypothetical protein
MIAGTMARKPKNPVNDIINTVGGWLGGRGPGTNPQVQAAMDATRAIARTADTATGGFGQALLSDAQRMAMTGSSTPSALYKTAAVNLGAAATGVGAAKVAGKVVSNVVGSGVPARIVNKARGEIVGLHGSPVKGLKEIEPRLSQWSPEGSPPKTFAANPSAKPPNAPRGAGIPFARETAQDYALGYSASVKPKEPGSIYVVKGRSYSGKNPLIISSPKPMKVLAEVEVMDPLSRVKINQALKRAGVKVPKYK